MSGSNTYHIAQSFGSIIKIVGENGRDWDVAEPASLASLGDLLKVCTIPDDRIVFSITIEARTLDEAWLKFSKELQKYQPRLVFLVRGSLETDCGRVIYEQGSDRSYLFLPSYGDGDVEFNVSYDTEIINKLVELEVPDEFYKYWRDASTVTPYSAKLLLMFSALEALVKDKEGKGKRMKMNEKEHKKLEEILGEKLKAKLFGGGEKALRNRLAHGDYYETHQDMRDKDNKEYEKQIDKQVMQYFKNDLLGGVVNTQNYFSEEFISPQRNSNKISETLLYLVESNKKGNHNAIDILWHVKKKITSSESESNDVFSDGSPYCVFYDLADPLIRSILKDDL